MFARVREIGNSSIIISVINLGLNRNGIWKVFNLKKIACDNISGYKGTILPGNIIHGQEPIAANFAYRPDVELRGIKQKRARV